MRLLPAPNPFQLTQRSRPASKLHNLSLHHCCQTMRDVDWCGVLCDNLAQPQRAFGIGGQECLERKFPQCGVNRHATDCSSPSGCLG